MSEGFDDYFCVTYWQPTMQTTVSIVACRIYMFNEFVSFKVDGEPRRFVYGSTHRKPMDNLWGSRESYSVVFTKN